MKTSFKTFHLEVEERIIQRELDLKVNPYSYLIPRYLIFFRPGGNGSHHYHIK